MKQVYLLSRFNLIICFLLFLVANLSQAQTLSSINEGTLRIKVSEQLATQLEKSKLSRDANNVLLTGIKSFDNVNRQFSVRELKRVFRPAGKFEQKHRKHKLHLWYEVKMDNAASVIKALAVYEALPEVLLSEPVYKKMIIGSDNKNFGPVIYDIADKKKSAVTLPGASNDPMLPQQWHYNNTGQTGGTPGADIKLFQAWGIETGKPNVIVAVTDGGIQVNHPDLAANMWINTDEIPGNGIDDDNNGYKDDYNGYGFGDNTGAMAGDAHGTHVGGTIAAVNNNGIGVAGVAGGSGTGDGARLMSCAAFGATGTGGFEDTYVYAADNGAVISQNSWGYTTAGVFDQVVLDGIDYFISEAGKDENGNQVGPMNGGIVIFAAGNNNTNASHYPGFYAPTLSVAATTHQDKKAWYSNFGDWVDIAAPGGETNVANQGVLSTTSNNQYAFFQGTSMACPHMSGLAALIVSKFGGTGFTPKMLRDRLMQTVDNIDAAHPQFAGQLGAGRINAFKALQQDDNAPPEAIDDLAAINVGITTLTLTWTSPTDVGSGSASSYDIRYSTTPITDANFNSVPQVAIPPAPKPAGSQESYTFKSLTPGTTYYFAIKSADFFSNTSAISNVVEQATNFAPVMVVSPTVINETLQTAQTSTKTFTISNNGEGPLEFTLVTTAYFASVTPISGIIAPHESMEVTVTFDSNGLLAGSYEQLIVVNNNDPAFDPANPLRIRLILKVTNNGAPIASVNPEAVDFGNVFVGGSLTKTVQIYNAGSDPLIISSVTSDDADFVANFSDSITVAAFDSASIEITFNPSALGAVAGTISIATNDASNSTLQVSVTGRGVEAPNIVVSPESLSETLNTDNIAVQYLTIKNTGESDLEFAIEVADGTDSVSTVKNITITSNGSSVKNAGEKQGAKPNGQASQTFAIKSVSLSAVKTKVLILTPDDNLSDVATILNSFEDVEATVFAKSGLPTLTVADLEGYQIVFVTNNTTWQASGVSSETVGNVLADYADQGGKVLVNQFAYSYDDWKMAGRFIDGQYGPFLPSTADANLEVELGDIVLPGHQIMEGVEVLKYTGYVQNVSLAPGATAIAKWSNGDLFLAANSNVVALNLLPSLGDGNALQWTGDLPTLYQNAIHYLVSSGSFVSVDPQEGVVAPNSEIQVAVTFDASGLDKGTYSSSLNITSNDPNEPLVSVATVLTVLGEEFIVVPDSLYEELEKEETSNRTIVLSNNGLKNVTFDVSVKNTGVSSVVIQKKTSVSKYDLAGAAKSAEKKKQNKVRSHVNVKGINSFVNNSSKRPAITAIGVEQYATDFEDFALGDIEGQNGWSGQWSNWMISTSNAVSGAQHIRSVSDGLGLTLAFSPEIATGTKTKSSTTMRVNLDGLGTTWQVIPQSNAEGRLNTRIQFSPDGSAQALVNLGNDEGEFVEISAAVPNGYFDLTIEVDRKNTEFNVYFNSDKVFTGKGFSGNIDQVVFLSLMEETGQIFDVDDFKIIDGKNESVFPYITVSPTSGNLGAGESVSITVKFNSNAIDFGTFNSDIIIDLDKRRKTLVVPAVLRVIGDPDIQVDPTVLQATVPYKGDTTRTFEITNTGGNPLIYSLQVIGASTDVSKLPAEPVSKFAKWKTDSRITAKLAKDVQLSRKDVSKQSQTISALSGVALLTENFNGETFPPKGWDIVDNAGSGIIWKKAAAWDEENYSGTGEAATVSSDKASFIEYDVELITPTISVNGYKNVAVQYNANYQNISNIDFFDLDIQVEGSTTWTSVLRWNEDHGTFRAKPGESVTVDLDKFLDDATSFKLRWHYYDPRTGDYDWYAQVDDVVILGDARAWLTVAPASDTIPVRGSQIVTAYFNAEDIEAGRYVSGILVNSNSVAHPIVGIVASLTVLDPAIIEVSPDSLYQELMVGETETRRLTISNTGVSPLTYSFESTATPVPSGITKKRVESKNIRTTVTPATSPKDLRAALHSGSTTVFSGSNTVFAVEQYATSFEEFEPGDINGQLGWTGQFSNWLIEGLNPFIGEQHLQSVSDGLGQTLAFTPRVAIGTDPISSATMHLNLNGDGVTWQIIPQSPTAKMVNTRFAMNPDRTMSILVADSTGAASYVKIPGTVPTGYFDWRIEIVRATSEFTIYINNELVFVGQGFAGNIEQIALLTLMEEAGSVLDIDDLAILDGAPQAPWLSVSPKSGTVAPGSSVTVDVTFNATELKKGVYTDTLNISSNDPKTPWTFVPVTLVVDSNIPPVLAVVDDLTVLEGQTVNVTFTATDEDDAVVKVTLLGAPKFITQVSKGNGTATYRIKPVVGDEGEYSLLVEAKDARGATDYDTVHLSVIQFAVTSFTLINERTGEELAEFTDAITINMPDSEHPYINVRANTTPPTVGSVKFKLDNIQRNIDNTNPYTLKAKLLSGLGVGKYVLYGEPFTEKSGHGQRGKKKQAVITVINQLTWVKDFSLIDKRTGAVITTFDDSLTVDAADSNFVNLNIRANTSSAPVGSVKFLIDGKQRNIDNDKPYIFKEKELQIQPVGNHVLRAEPFTEAAAKGQRGESNTAIITIVNSANPAARSASIQEHLSIEGGKGFNVFPIPVKDKLYVSLSAKIDGDIEVTIVNVRGQIIHTARVAAELIDGYTINTSTLNMTPGVYYIRLQDQKGNQEVKKLVKE